MRPAGLFQQKPPVTPAEHVQNHFARRSKHLMLVLHAQVKEELEATLLEKTKVPTEKYLQPVTTAQEIGWMHLEYGNVSFYDLVADTAVNTLMKVIHAFLVRACI